MRKGLLLVMALIIPGASGLAQLKPVTDKEKVSYSLGAGIAKNFKLQGVEVDVAMFSAGFKAMLAGDSTALSDVEMEKCVMEFQESMMKKQQDDAAKASVVQKQAGEAFLAENAKKEGVKTTSSGLQYKVLVMGAGKKPKATDEVTVHYRGTLIDGKEFDSSYRRGEPTTFPLNRVIKGWTEGLMLMPVGSKFEFFIKSELAYGDRQMGPDILPGSTLIFEVELLAIK
jgi:FKBP-type peptidyl-prolyl cis-trans isomerase